MVELSGGYSGRKKRSPQEQDLEDHIAEEAVEVKPVVEAHTRNFGDVSRILALAGAKPQVVELSGGYSGRKKRSPQNENLEDQIAEETVEVGPVVEVQARNFGDVSKILALAGAKPQVVELSGGYSGRKKRSTQDENLEDQIAEENENVEPVVEIQIRNFGDVSKILAIAGK